MAEINRTNIILIYFNAEWATTVSSIVNFQLCFISNHYYFYADNFFQWETLSPQVINVFNNVSSFGKECPGTPTPHFPYEFSGTLAPSCADAPGLSLLGL